MNGAAANTREALPCAGLVLRTRWRAAFAEAKPEERYRRDLSSAMIYTHATALDNMESAMNHPCQALADWLTWINLASRASKIRAELGVHPKALSVVLARCNAADGRDGGLTSVRRTARGVSRCRLRSWITRVWPPRGLLAPSPRPFRPRGGSAPVPACCTPREWGPHHLLRRRLCRPSPVGRTSRTGASGAVVRYRLVPYAKLMHCLPCASNVPSPDEVLD